MSAWESEVVGPLTIYYRETEEGHLRVSLRETGKPAEGDGELYGTTAETDAQVDAVLGVIREFVADYADLAEVKEAASKAQAAAEAATPEQARVDFLRAITTRYLQPTDMAHVFVRREYASEARPGSLPELQKKEAREWFVADLRSSERTDGLYRAPQFPRGFSPADITRWSELQGQPRQFMALRLWEYKVKDAWEALTTKLGGKDQAERGVNRLNRKGLSTKEESWPTRIPLLPYREQWLRKLASDNPTNFGFIAKVDELNKEDASGFRSGDPSEWFHHLHALSVGIALRESVPVSPAVVASMLPMYQAQLPRPNECYEELSIAEVESHFDLEAGEVKFSGLIRGVARKDDRGGVKAKALNAMRALFGTSLEVFPGYAHWTTDDITFAIRRKAEGIAESLKSLSEDFRSCGVHLGSLTVYNGRIAKRVTISRYEGHVAIVEEKRWDKGYEPERVNYRYEGKDVGQVPMPKYQVSIYTMEAPPSFRVGDDVQDDRPYSSERGEVVKVVDPYFVVVSAKGGTELRSSYGLKALDVSSVPSDQREAVADRGRPMVTIPKSGNVSVEQDARLSSELLKEHGGDFLAAFRARYERFGALVSGVDQWLSDGGKHPVTHLEAQVSRKSEPDQYGFVKATVKAGLGVGRDRAAEILASDVDAQAKAALEFIASCVVFYYKQATFDAVSVEYKQPKPEQALRYSENKPVPVSLISLLGGFLKPSAGDFKGDNRSVVVDGVEFITVDRNALLRKGALHPDYARAIQDGAVKDEKKLAEKKAPEVDSVRQLLSTAANMRPACFMGGYREKGEAFLCLKWDNDGEASHVFVYADPVARLIVALGGVSSVKYNGKGVIGMFRDGEVVAMVLPGVEDGNGFDHKALAGCDYSAAVTPIGLERLRENYEALFGEKFKAPKWSKSPRAFRFVEGDPVFVTKKAPLRKVLSAVKASIKGNKDEDFAIRISASGDAAVVQWSFADGSAVRLSVAAEVMATGSVIVPLHDFSAALTSLLGSDVKVDAAMLGKGGRVALSGGSEAWCKRMEARSPAMEAQVFGEWRGEKWPVWTDIDPVRASAVYDSLWAFASTDTTRPHLARVAVFGRTEDEHPELSLRTVMISTDGHRLVAAGVGAKGAKSEKGAKVRGSEVYIPREMEAAFAVMLDNASALGVDVSVRLGEARWLDDGNKVFDFAFTVDGIPDGFVMKRDEALFPAYQQVIPHRTDKPSAVLTADAAKASAALDKARRDAGARRYLKTEFKGGSVSSSIWIDSDNEQREVKAGFRFVGSERPKDGFEFGVEPVYLADAIRAAGPGFTLRVFGELDPMLILGEDRGVVAVVMPARV